MKPIDPAGFEAKFRADIDPWDYAHSPFEAVKRGRLTRACGARCHGRVLELACANGETTKALAPKALRLLAVDASATAIAEARRRLRKFPHVVLRTAELPGDIPRGPFDLVVISELLYYLPPNGLRRLLPGIARATAPGGRVVLLHHRKTFSDAAMPPARAHAQARRALRAWFCAFRRTRYGAYEVLIFDGRRA